MPPNVKPRRRPPIKRQEIVLTLRDEIRGGRLAPGDRLPTRVDLAARFKTGSVTVQQAMEELVADGFLVAQDRQGTYVAHHPPHLYQIALCFPDSPSSRGWVRFWTAILNEADRLQTTTPWRFRKYFNCRMHTQSPGYEELLRDYQAGCLMGAAFPHYPIDLEGSPMLTDLRFPRVGIHTSEHRGFASVHLDAQSLHQRALEHLKARGCRRVAVMIKNEAYPVIHERTLAIIQNLGMETRADWFQGLPVLPAECPAQVAHLMFNTRQSERPDGVFITDDNLAEGVTAGMVDAGVQPTDVQIVTHCNFPWPTPTHLPARRIGYDIRRLVSLFTGLLQAYRPDGMHPRQLLQARFEEELDTSSG